LEDLKFLTTIYIYILTFEIALVKQQISEASGVNFLNYSSGNGHQVALPYWQSHLVAISGTIVVKG